MARGMRAGNPPKTNRSPRPSRGGTYTCSHQRSSHSRVERVVAAAKAKKDLSAVFHRILTGVHVPGAHLDIAGALLAALVGASVVDDVMSHKGSSNVRLRDRQAGVGVIANKAGVREIQRFASELVLGEEASSFFVPDTVLKLIPDVIALLSMPGLRVVRAGLVRRAEAEKAKANEALLQEASTKGGDTTASPANRTNTEMFPWREEDLQHPATEVSVERAQAAAAISPSSTSLRNKGYDSGESSRRQNQEQQARPATTPSERATAVDTATNSDICNLAHYQRLQQASGERAQAATVIAPNKWQRRLELLKAKTAMVMGGKEPQAMRHARWVEVCATHVARARALNIVVRREGGVFPPDLRRGEEGPDGAQIADAITNKDSVEKSTGRSSRSRSPSPRNRKGRSPSPRRCVISSPRAREDDAVQDAPDSQPLEQSTEPVDAERATEGTTYHPLGSLFSPPLDESGTVNVVKEIFCQREGNEVHCAEANRLAKAIRLGRVDVKSMSRLMQGFTSARGAKMLEERGVGYVGPRPSVGQFFTSGQGMSQLLDTISSNSAVGQRFVLCFSSGLDTCAHLVTGSLEQDAATTHSATNSAKDAPRAVIYGESCERTGRPAGPRDAVKGVGARVLSGKDWAGVYGECHESLLCAWVYGGG